MNRIRDSWRETEAPGTLELEFSKAGRKWFGDSNSFT